MQTSINQLTKVYNAIKGDKSTFGRYHKTLFHLHTPSSHDYELKSSKNKDYYKRCTESDLISIVRKQGIVPTAFDVENYTLPSDSGNIYDDKKEWLAFLILANELFKHQYEIVLVSDHNTFSGVTKLKNAIEELYKYNKDHAYPEVLFGIEISCADKLHVVGIIDDDKRQKRSLSDWLKDNLISEKEGTYETSLSVMSFFNSIGGISYIAHINSADIFKKEKFLSGAYKKKLRDAGGFRIVGVHEKKQIEPMKSAMKSNKVDDARFVIDNDAHCVENISKNYFWIKCGKVSFSSVKEALDDFDVSVLIDWIPSTRKYIYGMYIEREEGAFIQAKNEGEPFVLTFSDSLNCFIGGRGTGKSTILQILDYILGQRVDDEKILDFICRHGNAYILFADGEKEYLIETTFPIKQEVNENILRYFGQNPTNKYNHRYYFNPHEIADIALKNYLTIYRVMTDSNRFNFKAENNKRKVLEQLYDTRYSVNQLVQTASGDEIHGFVMSMLFHDRTISRPQDTIRVRSVGGLANMLSNTESVWEKRQSEVNEIIIPFNQKEKERLRIEYTQNAPVNDPDIERWMFGRKADLRQHFKSYPITEENIVQYILNVYDQVGINNLIRLSVDKKSRQQRYNYEIEDFLTKPVDATERKSVIDEAFDSLVTDQNLVEILDYLKLITEQVERFSLSFNICSNTGSKKKPLFKEIAELSLGQKWSRCWILFLDMESIFAILGRC